MRARSGCRSAQMVSVSNPWVPPTRSDASGVAMPAVLNVGSSLAALMLLLPVTAHSHSPVNFGTPNVIHACKSVGGILRQITSGNCAPPEVVVHWNITGPAAATGSQGATGVIDGEAIGPSILKGDGFVFYGPTVTLDTSAGQRMAGAASADLVLGGDNGGTTNASLGLCYQPTIGGAITSFAATPVNTSLTQSPLVQDRSIAASTSTLPGAGSWTVGFCIQNLGNGILNDGAQILQAFALPVNGWVQVTN